MFVFAFKAITNGYMYTTKLRQEMIDYYVIERIPANNVIEKISSTANHRHKVYPDIKTSPMVLEIINSYVNLCFHFKNDLEN